MSRADDKRYQIVADSYEREFSRADRLDLKANNLMTLSGTLMTLFLGLGTFMLEKVAKDNLYLYPLRSSLVVGLALFSIDIFILVRAYRLLKYRFDPDPKEIIDTFGNTGYTDLTLQVTSNIVAATLDNRGLNDDKAKTLTRGFHVLWIAIFFVLLYGILLVGALSSQ